jgi:hypothetical protein
MQFSVKEQLRSGELTTTGDEWPMFLYHGYTYDPEDPWNGLFRSSLLITVSLYYVHAIPLTRATGLQTHIYLSKFC